MMKTQQRIQEFGIVFIVFGISGLVGMFLLELATGSSSGVPSSILPLPSFGLSGCLAWWVICHRNSERWPIAGLLGGINSAPALLMAQIIVESLLSNRLVSPADVLQGIALAPIEFLMLTPASVLSGLVGAYASQSLLNRPPRHHSSIRADL